MLNISWNPAAGAVSYKVTVKSPGDPDHVSTTTNTAAAVNLPATKPYEVTVAGVNAGGEGPASAPVNYVPSPPDQVTGVVVAAS